MMPVTMDTLNEESIVQEASEQRDRQASPLVDTKQRKEGGKMERKDRDDKEKEKERERRREKEKEKEKEKKKRDDKDPKMSALNAQLVATGYTTRGIKLEGLSNADQERVSNVLTGLLDGSSVSLPPISFNQHP
jgi:hypothetical protein